MKHTVLSMIAAIGVAAGFNAHAADLSVSEAFDFTKLPELVAAGGGSMLWRTDSGIEWTFNTTGLRSMTPHTVWIVVFNNPEYCADGCGDDDLPPYNADADPRIDTSVLWGGGLIVGADGVGNFSGKLTNGTAPSQVGWGPGMINADKAEIHLVVRHHGDIVVGEAASQLATATGGNCPAPSPSPVSGSEACPDLQFAVHLPPSTETAAAQ